MSLALCLRRGPVLVAPQPERPGDRLAGGPDRPAARGGSRSCGSRPARGSSCRTSTIDDRLVAVPRRAAISRRQSRPVASSSTSSAPPSRTSRSSPNRSTRTRRRSTFRSASIALTVIESGSGSRTRVHVDAVPRPDLEAVADHASAGPCSACSRPRSSVRATSGRSETIASPSSAHHGPALRASSSRASIPVLVLARDPCGSATAAPRRRRAPPPGRASGVELPGLHRLHGFARVRTAGRRAHARRSASPRPASRRPGRHRSSASAPSTIRRAGWRQDAPGRPGRASRRRATSARPGRRRQPGAAGAGRSRPPRTRRRGSRSASDPRRPAGPTSRGPPRCGARHASRGGVPTGGRGRAARRGRSTAGCSPAPMSPVVCRPRIHARDVAAKAAATSPAAGDATHTDLRRFLARARYNAPIARSARGRSASSVETAVALHASPYSRTRSATVGPSSSMPAISRSPGATRAS